MCVYVCKEWKILLSIRYKHFREPQTFKESLVICIGPCTKNLVVAYDSEETANADCVDETINDVVYCCREFTTDLENYAHPLELSLNSDGTHEEFMDQNTVRTIESNVYVF